MKKNHFLKVLRVMLAILFFVPVLLFFFDFADVLPDRTHVFAEIQLIPAIFGSLYVVVGVLFLLTLTFGRIYCSVICPAGVLQDVINRIFCIGKKKPKGVFRFRYRKPLNLFRYVLLGITAGLAVFGFTELCMLLDPYSNFGRVAANLFRPAVIWGNNLLASVLNSMGNYMLYHTSITSITIGSLIAAGFVLLLFAVMVSLRGRLFCNSLCPVGALLSVVSRFSIFRIIIDHKKCNHCRTCERTCKAEAIHGKLAKIDMSRCVNCFNCLPSCRQNALKYRLFFLRGATSETTGSAVPSKSRRAFIATSAAIAAAAPVAILQAKSHQYGDTDENISPVPVTPPGSLNLERFKDKCTACHLCVTQCPSHVLRPAGLEYGFGFLLRPRMAYIDSYCNYECTVCADVCPTSAIKPITVEEKKTTQIGIAYFYEDRCVVSVKNQDCGACSEHCPTQAVHMIPYKGTLTIPKVEAELCVGCGGCESICPVSPDRAIIIKAHPVHQLAEKPKEEEAIKVDVNEFGF
ncbi:MAG: 4Fe-4S dicluster domain-containing protein [Tannerella sp.]|jgi:ferredoxin|nr:4Fe-4S dicluster domain-containing protein [Tannerella sp.]